VRSRERFACFSSLGAFMWRVSPSCTLHNPHTRMTTYSPDSVLAALYSHIALKKLHP
jgi:hypothetical protein